MARTVYTLRDYLDITVGEARLQWETVQRRVPRERQEDFVPVETLMCLAAMYVVDHMKHGGSSRAPRAPEPVPGLARLFVRKPTSILRKMGNLDGTFPRGGKWDLIAGARLRADSSRMAEVYRRVLAGARAAGIGPDRLPDFLALEGGEELVLLGQDELDRDAIDSVVEDELDRWIERQQQIPERETERLLLASVRISQHRFAVEVMHNCGGACVFCDFSLGDGKPPTLLRASHIKPWRESSHRERLDMTNGLAACPTHDAAFDAGLLTLDDGLRVSRSPRLEAAIRRNDGVRRAFGPGAIHERIRLPIQARRPSHDFLDWHRTRVFATSA